MAPACRRLSALALAPDGDLCLGCASLTGLPTPALAALLRRAAPRLRRLDATADCCLSSIDPDGLVRACTQPEVAPALARLVGMRLDGRADGQSARLVGWCLTAAQLARLAAAQPPRCPSADGPAGWEVGLQWRLCPPTNNPGLEQPDPLPALRALPGSASVHLRLVPPLACSSSQAPPACEAEAGGLLARLAADYEVASLVVADPFGHLPLGDGWAAAVAAALPGLQLLELQGRRRWGAAGASALAAALPLSVALVSLSLDLDPGAGNGCVAASAPGVLRTLAAALPANKS